MISLALVLPLFIAGCGTSKPSTGPVCTKLTDPVGTISYFKDRDTGSISMFASCGSSGKFQVIKSVPECPADSETEGIIELLRAHCGANSTANTIAPGFQTTSGGNPQPNGSSDATMRPSEPTAPAVEENTTNAHTSITTTTSPEAPEEEPMKYF